MTYYATPAKSTMTTEKLPTSTTTSTSSTTSSLTSSWSWRHRLYASLLRHALGPYLTPQSANQLHKSIQNVDWSDGTLALENLELDPDYLTGLLLADRKSNDKNSSVGDSVSNDGGASCGNAVEDAGEEDNFENNGSTNNSNAMNAVVKHAKIRRFAIHLSLCDKKVDSKSNNNDSSSSSSTARKATSVLLRSIFGSGDSSSDNNNNNGGESDGLIGGMALVAYVELEGLDLAIVPGSANQKYGNHFSGKRKSRTKAAASPARKENTTGNSNQEGSSSSSAAASAPGFFSSLVDSAMKSLRLSINVSDVRVRFLSANHASKNFGNSAFSSCSWLGLHIASARYYDLIDVENSNRGEGNKQSDSNNDNSRLGKMIYKSKEKLVISKALDWEGLVLETGECNNVDSSSLSCKDTKAILRGEGEGSVRFRVFEKWSDSGGGSDKSQMKIVSARQDIAISFGKGLAAEMDASSLTRLVTIANVLQGKIDSTSADGCDEDDDFMDAKDSDNNSILPNQIEGRSTPSKSTPATLNDEFSKETYDQIMKQYTEARHLARTRELRGGLLIPSFEECDGADESAGGEISFDAFFDANDHSVSYYYGSIMEEVGGDGVGSSGGGLGGNGKGSLEQTKVELDLAGFTFKFDLNDATSVTGGDHLLLGSNSVTTNQFSEDTSEFVLLSVGDLRIMYFGSEGESTVNCSVARFDIESEMLEALDHYSREPCPMHESILRFIDCDESELVVSKPPCVSILVEFSDPNHEQVKGSGIRVDVMLQPIEFVHNDRAISRLSEMIEKVKQPTAPENEYIMKNDEAGNLHVSFSCTSIAVLIPCQNYIEQFSPESKPNPLFQRCGYKDHESRSSHFMGLGVELDNISVDLSKKCYNADFSSNIAEESKAVIKCSNAVFFAKCTQLERGRKSRKFASYVSRRNDLMAFTGDEGKDSDAFLVISFSRVEQKDRGGENENSFKRSSTFPMVLPLSSMKAHQENDDSDSDEIEDLYIEAIKSMDYPTKIQTSQTMKASDPQYILSSEANEAERELVVTIPNIFVDFTTCEREELSKIISCFGSGKATMGPNSDDANVRTEEHLLEKQEKRNFMGFALNVGQISVVLHGSETNKSVPQLSYSFIFDKMQLHALVTSDGIRNIRVLSHDLTLFEIDCCPSNVDNNRYPATCADRCKQVQQRFSRIPSTMARAIFFRSKLCRPLSPDTPALIVDALFRKDCGHGFGDESDERSVHVNIYDMTYRHDMTSQWIQNLTTLIKGSSTSEEANESSESSTSLSLLNLFVNLTDCNLDYESPLSFKNASRIILRMGEFRFTSNILTPPCEVQAYKLSLSDLCLHICNYRHPYNEENSLLSCARRYFHKDDLCPPGQTKNLSNGNNASLDDVLCRMDFVSVAVLDMLDAIILCSNRVQDQNGNTEQKDPATTVALTLGRISLHACQDSFSCLNETYNEWFIKTTALSEEALEELRVKSESQSKIGGEFGSLKSESLPNPMQLSLEGDGTSSINNNSQKSHTKTLPANHDVKSSPSSTQNGVTIHPKQQRVFRDDTVSLDLTKSLLFQNYYTIDAKHKNESLPRRETKPPILRVQEDEIDEEWTAVEHEFLRYSNIPRDQEQTTEWVACGDDSSMEADRLSPQKIKVFPHHIPVKPILDPLAGGTMDAAKLAGTDKTPDIGLRVIVKDASMTCRFYDGSDWVSDPPPSHSRKKGTQDRRRELLGNLIDGEEGTDYSAKPFPLLNERKSTCRKPSRNANKYFQISFEGLKLRQDSFAESAEHRLASCLDLSITDFFIAECVSNKRPIKMLGEWVNEREHPRDNSDGVIMLKMVTKHPSLRVSADGKLMSDESRATLELLPLRCYFNQSAIRFIQRFFAGNPTDAGSEAEDGGEVLDEELINIFFQTFKVFPCKLKVDYIPEKMDVDAFRDGSYVEILNLCPLEEMVLTLQEVENTDLTGWGSVFRELAGKWIEDICATQAHKFFTKAAPIQVFSDLGEGVADLVIIPLAVSDGNFTDYIKCLLEGTSSFAEKALRTSAKITQFAANQLNNNLSYGQTNSRLPSRPQNVPRHAGDAAGYACESIVRGLREANYKIVTLPCREYQRNGAGGAARSAVRGIPVAVLAPLSGASEALSYTLLGLRNQLRPDLRKEEEASQRGLNYDS